MIYAVKNFLDVLSTGQQPQDSHIDADACSASGSPAYGTSAAGRNIVDEPTPSGRNRACARSLSRHRDPAARAAAAAPSPAKMSPDRRRTPPLSLVPVFVPG
jgi:hypothetical protein